MGKTALGWSIYNDTGKPYPEIADILRQHGATILTSGVKRTGIHTAVCIGDLERVKVLLAEKPELIQSTDDVFHGTPLHTAVGSGKLEITKFLLKNKADVTAKDIMGETPLHAAVRFGRLDVVEQLLPTMLIPCLSMLKAGLCYTTPFWWKYPNNSIAVKSKANAKGKDKRGLSPIDYAIALEHRDIVRAMENHETANAGH